MRAYSNKTMFLYSLKPASFILQVQLGSASTSLTDPAYKSFWGFHILPERPGQPVCQYYMGTGDCKNGVVCEFHHPKDRETHVPESFLSPSWPKQRGTHVPESFLSASWPKYRETHVPEIFLSPCRPVSRTLYKLADANFLTFNKYQYTRILSAFNLTSVSISLSFSVCVTFSHTQILIYSFDRENLSVPCIFALATATPVLIVVLIIRG